MILLVEDDAITRTAMAETLRITGRKILEATNGQEGLALLDQHPFRLVVLDFILPDMDGLQFLKRIDDRRPRIPVILVSGYLSQKAETIFERPGAKVKYFAKPVRPSALVATVQAFLRP